MGAGGYFALRLFKHTIMNVKRMILVVALVAGATAAFAQKEGTTDKHDETVSFRPHWFMRVQGGVGHTLGENDFGKLTSPAAALQAGYRFTPVWGLRFGLSGWQGKGSWVAPRTDYDFNYLQLGADAVVDLGNWIGGFNYRRFWNPYLFAGVGGAVGFNNDGAQALADAGNDLPYLWDGSRFFGVGRMGLGMDFRICEAVAFNLEGNANVLSDHFNSKKAGNADWQFNLLAGVTIRFGKGHAKKAEPAPVVVPPPAPKPQPQPEPQPEPKPVEKAVPVEVKKPEPMQQDVFFALNSSVIREGEKSKIEALATYLKENAEAKVTITGYADKETGNPRYNQTLSQKRAEAVAAVLKAAGIDGARITVDAKGDSVQPFGSSAQNRVAICVTE